MAHIGLLLQLIIGRVTNLTFMLMSSQNITDATVNITHIEQKIKSLAPAQNIADQKNLLIATNIGDKSSNQVIGLSLNFKHILSQIALQAKCSNDKVRIEVLGIKLVNMATKADFTFPNTPNTIYVCGYRTG